MALCFCEVGNQFIEVEVLGEDDRHERIEFLLRDFDPFIELPFRNVYLSLGEFFLEQGQFVLSSECIKFLLAYLQFAL